MASLDEDVPLSMLPMQPGIVLPVDLRMVSIPTVITLYTPFQDLSGVRPDMTPFQGLCQQIGLLNCMSFLKLFCRVPFFPKLVPFPPIPLRPSPRNKGSLDFPAILSCRFVPRLSPSPFS